MKKIKPTKDEFHQNMSLLKKQKKLMILDLESTCTDDPDEKNTFVNEVIEFGIVVLDLEKDSYEKIQMFTKPKKSVLNEFCTSLTGITWEQVRRAPIFKDNMPKLKKIIDDNQIEVFVSFGDYDKNQLKRQAQRDGAINPFENLDHINIRLNAWYVSGLGKPLGLWEMMKHFNLPFEGSHHSGVDDAYNISKLTKVIMNQPEPIMQRKLK